MTQQQIAAFLRQIPQSNQDAIAIDEITQHLNPDIAYGYALMLQTIGMVHIDEKRYIKAASQTAKYMLESLASYVEQDLQWIDDWKTRGVHREPTGVLQNGATLLHELETRRLALLADPMPSRIEEVVQVIIKRTNPETGVSELLMQYDANANQYQLIGGRRSPSDQTIQDAIIREIDEEIANILIFETDYQLSLLIPDMIVEATLSRTFGALTQYHFMVYHMTNLNQEIILQAEDAWIPLDEVLRGDANSDEPSGNSLYQQMDAALRGGIEQLSDSFSI